MLSAHGLTAAQLRAEHLPVLASHLGEDTNTIIRWEVKVLSTVRQTISHEADSIVARLTAILANQLSVARGPGGGGGEGGGEDGNGVGEGGGPEWGWGLIGRLSATSSASNAIPCGRGNTRYGAVGAPTGVCRLDA